ncbi:tyrosine-type recombinase/integrase [Geobacter sp. FeAm09]|uniref:Arm DNA-binding domain-containing protein n=1 Tax=Geobacter sp. FeAm09 TaxID=2597769 RepID=UPI0011EC5F93|nr:tyrosine-type recombinase/integrase [Geobacter sp. FeAm09]QEM67402.1 tyrosine-type recombinase/integrase [Geobacter sp. FeAm09]
MKKTVATEMKKPWHRKPEFGSLYTMKGSRFIYISMNYFKQRLRFPTDREDTPENWEELCEFMDKVGEKIKRRTFSFSKSFYWLDARTKEHFTQLEGNDYQPEAEHVLFRDYAEGWMARKIPTFASITKQRDYREALNSRILPYFGEMPFSKITATEIELFIDNLKRSKGSQGNLSVKRIKNLLIPMSKVWSAAVNDHNWFLHNPFEGISAKYDEIKDKAVQEKERKAALADDGDEACSTRDVFLLPEWLKLLACVDPHYHVVMELLLMGMIGSELEGLQKRHVKDVTIQVRCAVVRDKDGKSHLKFKPKNWYRKREIPLSAKLKRLAEQAAASSTSNRIIRFEDDLELPAQAFLLTMKDGGPFNYDSFRKTVWDKAIRQAGIENRVPYASRHTFVQWALLIGVNKNRLVDLMGHSTKKMIDEVYGRYRKGLVEERQEILDYLGDDFLALEELRTAFPERYRQKMALPAIPLQIAEAPAMAIAFGQSFGQSQGLYPDNYLR